MSRLEYTIEAQNDVLLVRLCGSADHEQTSALQRCTDLVQGPLRRSVVLDLSGLTFIARAALGALVGLARVVKARSGEFVLTNLSESVAEIMIVMRLDRLFRICATTEEAIACCATA
jgi:anti-anti-sigma factor